MSSPKHIRTGFLFIAVCALIGVGLFFLTSNSTGAKDNEAEGVTEVASNEASDFASESNMFYSDAEPPPEDEGVASAGEQSSPATLSENSVWTEASAGTLSCQMNDRAFDIQWQRVGTDSEASIAINGKTVVGELVGDWHPPSNTVRYDFEGSIPAISAELRISDEGSLTITNGQTDEVAEGRCQRA